MSFLKIFYRKEQIITARHKKLRPGTNSYGQAHIVTACGVPLLPTGLPETSFHTGRSVANSLQHFPARMAKNFGRWVKKFGPFVKITYWNYFIKLRLNFEAMLVHIKGKNILRIRALFGPFWENPAKIRLQIFPATYIFIRPLLSFAAEESASWKYRTDRPSAWIVLSTSSNSFLLEFFFKFRQT